MDRNIAEIEKELKGAAPPPEPAPPRNGLKDRLASSQFWRRIAGAAVVIALVTIAVIYHYYGRVSTDDAQVDGHITPIASKVYGKVAQVLVDDNQHVKAGDVLVRIDPRDNEAKVAQAKAALALAEGQAHAADVGVPWTRETTASGTSSAEAQLAAAEAEFGEKQAAYQQASTADLAYARANMDAKQASYDRAQADLARMKPLLAKAEISQQQYDAYLATARVAESELTAAKERLTAAQQTADVAKSAMLAKKAKVVQARASLEAAQANHKQVNIRQADAAAAAAAVAQAKANLEAAKLQLSYTTVNAPIEGVVTKKSVEVGQVVQPGQGLLVLIPLQDVWVTANFKETQLKNVRPGQKAEVEVDMYGETFPGHVDSIAGATGARLSLLPPENATGNFVKVVQRIPVKIVLDPIPPEKAILRPGMNVDATILTK